MRILILILIAVILGTGGYLLWGRSSAKPEYDPRIVSTFTRLGVINQLYRSDPDSCRSLRDAILREEGLSEEDVLAQKSYMEANPAYFGEFLNSVETLIDSLCARPIVELRREIYPKEALEGISH